MTSARVGVLGVFFLHGTGAGMWVARIPAVQERLGLGAWALVLALFGVGFGMLLAMVPTGTRIAHRGSRSVVLWMAWPAALTLALPAIAPNGPALFAALVAWGASTSALDVAMNAQGSTIEQRRGRPLMSSLHGFWSMGNMSGAAVGALLAGAGVAVQVHLVAAAPILLVALVAAGRLLVPGDAGHEGAVFVRPRGALLALAAVAFCAVTVEGAMFDWGAVYLRRVFAAPEATAASAAGCFSAAMATGRLFGDQLTARVRATHLARACALLAALGVGALIAAPSATLVLGGLVAVGIGLSILVPLAFGAAGRSTEMAAGTAFAAVATMGYLGFLVGPPTLGLTAEQVGLRGAFALLLGLLALIAVLANAIGDQHARQGSVGNTQVTVAGGPFDP